mgnify:FL=1
MIVDRIENLGKYVALHPLFAEVVTFMQTHQLVQLEEGKLVIKGKELFVNIETCKGKTQEEAVLEYHRRMIDIQMPLTTDEIFGYSPIEDLPEMTFDEEKDIAKISGISAQTYVKVKPGQFAVFFPQDAHAPCIADAECMKKAIFKVKK